MQPVLDPLMAVRHTGEGLGTELGRAKVIVSFLPDLAVPLGPAFHHADHSKAWKGWLAGAAAVENSQLTSWQTE